MYPKLGSKNELYISFHGMTHGLSAGGERQPTHTVSKILINKSHPQPATKKAPAGGKMIVTRMRITSEALTDMVMLEECNGVGATRSPQLVHLRHRCGDCGNHRPGETIDQLAACSNPEEKG